jgi:hypothetical protein
MSKQIDKINTFFPKNLVSFASIGMIAFFMLLAGCTDQNTGTNETASPEAITKRIEPVGKVNVANPPEKANETTATSATSQESSEEDGSQTPAHDDEAGSQRADAEKASPTPTVNNDQE